MMVDYDDLIKATISEWRKLPNHNFTFQKIALERHIIPLIYFNVRKEILHEKVVARSRSFSLKFNQVSKSILHIYWILLWSVKWLFFFRSNREPIIVTAVGSDRKLSFAYLNYLLDYAKENQYSLVTLNVICNKVFLFRRKVFYFPRFLFENKFKQEITKFSCEWNQLLNGLSKLIKKNILIEVDLGPVKRFIKDYSRDYYCVDYFLNKFRQDILLLIQDFDYTSNRNIYCEIFKLKSVPTVSLNHSILIYDHIYESVYSDYAFIWGEHQNKRIEKLSKNQMQRISVLGHPWNFYKKTKSADEKKYWIYYLPSFENPAAETIYRSVEFTLEYINCILRFIEDEKVKIQLFTCSHPNDSVGALQKAGFKINRYSFSKIFDKTGLLFCEDSTVAIEMLKTDKPIIYIADKLKRDLFNFNDWSTVEISHSKDELQSGIRKALSGTIDYQKREKNFCYYFGDGKNFYMNLRDELNRITIRNVANK
jgi:hypothetical protein